MTDGKLHLRPSDARDSYCGKENHGISSMSQITDNKQFRRFLCDKCLKFRELAKLAHMDLG